MNTTVSPQRRSGRYLRTVALIALVVFGMGGGLTSVVADEDLLAACKARDIEASISACSRLLEGDPSPDIATIAHKIRGYRLKVKTEYAAAVTDFTAALALKPGDTDLLTTRGDSYIALNKLDLAVADLDAAIRIKPDSSIAYAGRSTVNFLLGDMDKTIADASAAIGFDPKQVAAYNNRGAALREKGDYEGAIRNLNIAIRLNPYFSRPLYNRGLTSFRKGDLRSALADYDAAVLLNPKEIDAVRGRDAVKALLPAVPKPPVSAPSVPLPAASAPAEGSRVLTVWTAFAAEKLGVRFLFEKAKVPSEGYSYEESADWIDQRPASGAAQASHFIRVLNKPAGQPIEDAIREKFVDTMPTEMRARCSLRPYASQSGSNPAKPSFEIAQTGEEGRKIDERRRDPNAVSRPAGNCGFYGIKENDSYFEYHPNENKEKYLYVSPGFDAAFDEKSISIRPAADQDVLFATTAPPQDAMPDDLASKLWSVSLNANADGSLYCEALLNGRRQSSNEDYSIHYQVETQRRGNLVVTYSGAPMKGVEQISTALDGRQLGAFPATVWKKGKDNAVVARVNAISFREKQLNAFAKSDASFLQLKVGEETFEVPVRGYSSINASLDACVIKLPTEP